MPALAVRARDMITAEWTKLRSVRSTYWTLLITAVAAIGVSALNAHVSATAPPPPKGVRLPQPDPLALSFSGLVIPVLAVGVLGVLAVSSEYATGLIRTTFTAHPQRRAVLTAKSAVAGTVALIAAGLLCFASFFLVQAILSGHRHSLSVSHPGVPGAVLAAGFLPFACAELGLRLGAVIRHTAGAVAALFALTLVLPLILNLLPSPWNDRIGRFMLPVAAQQVLALHPQTALLSPALSMLVLIAWPAAALLTAPDSGSRRSGASGTCAQHQPGSALPEGWRWCFRARRASTVYDYERAGG